MGYKIRVTGYKPVKLNEKDVMPVAEAARTLGLTMPGVIRAIERGTLTEVIDEDANYHGRRLVLRTEVNRLAQEKSGSAAPAGGDIPAGGGTPAIDDPSGEGVEAVKKDSAADAAAAEEDAALRLDVKALAEGKSAVLPVIIPRSPDDKEESGGGDYLGYLVIQDEQEASEEDREKLAATLHFINPPPGYPANTALPFQNPYKTSGIDRALLQYHKRRGKKKTPGTGDKGEEKS